MYRLAFLAAMAAAPGAASAQAPSYPDKPVKLIVGFSAGGPTDIVTRTFAERAGQALRQPFIVENKPGANSVLAAEAVASAKADGYTLLGGAANHSMIPALYADRVKFDAAKSFRPVCAYAKSPNVLVVTPGMGVKTVGEFLRKIREKPGTYTYGSVGIGSSVHFATADFLNLTRTSMVHVPYKGAAPASTALLAGEVDSYFASVGSVLPHIKSGRVIAIAVAAKQRSALIPDVPTFDEGGVKGFYADAWYGVLAPAGTPDAVVRVLEREAVDFARQPAVRDKLAAAGLEPYSSCGETFAAQIAAEIATYSRVAKDLNLKVE
jgi:tripartite-type tricarboxylate transporter receptor subunit TctC